MLKEDRHGYIICLFENHKEYVTHLTKAGYEIGFADSNGGEIKINPDDVDWSCALAKNHFSPDSEYKPEYVLWEVFPDEKSIHCILLHPEATFSMKEIFTSIGHELGHLIDADSVINATHPCETEIGYEQEEQKGQWFESFSEKLYDLSYCFTQMLRQLEKQNNTNYLINKFQ